MDMTPDRWNATTEYLDDVFGVQDAHLENLMPRALEAGLPDIAVSPAVGRFLLLLSRMTAARTIVEVGTLAGYSGTWLARGMADGGRLITMEPNPKHADFAEAGFAEAGLADRVEVRRTTGLEGLPKLVDELGDGSVDMVFLDAIKSEYPEYLPHAKRLLRTGGLLIVDNALGGGSWWIDTPAGTDENRDGADRINRMIAEDPDFDAACLPIREGVAVGRKR